MMVRKTVGKTAATFLAPALIGAFLVSIGTLGQSPPGQGKAQSPSSTAGIEFPVILRQNVVAGKTPPGAKVQATLTVATLVNGVVVPQDAIFSGEVIESVAKTATNPSRLSLCVESVRWKNNPQSNKTRADKNKPTAVALAPRVCLTAWYYPILVRTDQAPSSLTPDTDNPMGGLTPGGRRSRRNSASQPFPTSDANPVPAPPEVAMHRIRMKDVESARTPDGAITLSSKLGNLKFDKVTTYVLAAREPGANP